MCSNQGMHTEDIEYQADGRRMIGHLAIDDSSDRRRPGVLLSHEGPGLGDHVRGRAERLASLGYVAFALDYHGEGRPYPLDEVMARLGELRADPPRLRNIALAGLDILLARPQTDPSRVAAIGYCFGGAVSLELARTGAELKAIVGFHPGLLNPKPEESRNIKASVLMCIGADDPFATADQRLAFESDMRDAGVADWRVELYGGVKHSFTNPEAGQSGLPGIEYNAAADRRSRRSMLDLFDEVFATS